MEINASLRCPGRRRRWSKAGVASLIVVAMCLTACGNKGGDDDDDAGSTVAAVTPVIAVKVTRGAISQVLTLTGSVAAPPNKDVKVSALVPGRISELKVAEGDRVMAGQVVAKIDDHTYQNQLQQAEAAVAQAHANLDNATAALDRNQNLVTRGIAARKDLEDATMAKGVATAGVQQADAALSIARLQLQRTDIASPIDGTVVKRFVSVGEQVDGTSAQPIFEVANVSDLEIDGNLPPADLGRLHVGEMLHFTSDAFPGKAFNGHVIAISPAVDPATGTGLARVGVANSGGMLRIGMFLSAHVPVETHNQALLVPAQAVYRDQEGKAHVYIVMGDTANATDVELGIETTENDEVLSGVKEGDTVVLTGGYGLPDKAKVSVKSAAAGAGQDQNTEKSDKPDKKDAGKAAEGVAKP